MLAITRSEPGNDVPSASIDELAALIERTFRYSYVQATKMRDDMIRQVRKAEMEKLVAGAREVLVSLRKAEAE